jgi:hypothetical protein
MASARAKDRLDPQLERELYFSDLTMARRRMAQLLVFVIVNAAVVLAGLYLGGSWERVALFGSSVAMFGFGMLARDTHAVLLRVDDATDPRLLTERRRVRALRVWAGVVIAVQVVGVIVSAVRQTDGGPLLASAAPATVEFVDVTMVPTPIDFQRPITVDVSSGRVSQIGPHDASRAKRVQNFRSFAAQGKFLVAVDASRADWQQQIASNDTPLDIDAAGDFLVLDRDPRVSAVTRYEVAAAVIGGKYLGRDDARAALK